MCGSAPAIAALLGRFLPRLEPLVATQAALLSTAERHDVVFHLLVRGVGPCNISSSPGAVAARTTKVQDLLKARA